MNESLDCKTGLDLIFEVVKEMDKIRKLRLLKDAPRTQEAIQSNVTFDADKINMAYSVLVHAILAQGIYGKSLLDVQMPPPGGELTQNESQREWASARVKIQQEAIAKARQGKEKAIQRKEKAIEEKEKITQEKEKETQEEEKALQAAAAERKAADEAERKLQELLAQQQTNQATGVNTNSNTGSSSSFSANPPVSMGSSVLTGFQAATGVSSRSASPIPVADINAADIDAQKNGSVYSATI
jgi:outer membrane biosynthesis protein TonB